MKIYLLLFYISFIKIYVLSQDSTTFIYGDLNIMVRVSDENRMVGFDNEISYDIDLLKLKKNQLKKYYFRDSVNPKIVRLTGSVQNGQKVGIWVYSDSFGRQRKIVNYPIVNVDDVIIEFHFDSLGKIQMINNYSKFNRTSTIFYSDSVFGLKELIIKNSDSIFKYSQIEKNVITHYEYKFKDSIIFNDVQYFKSGKLLWEKYIRNGKKDSVWRYGIDGLGIWCLEKYQDGLLTELSFTNGKRYKNLHIEQVVEDYYSNGNIRVKGNIKNNRKIGKWYFYSEDGSVMGYSYHDENGNCIGFSGLIKENFSFF